MDVFDFDAGLPERIPEEVRASRAYRDCIAAREELCALAHERSAAGGSLCEPDIVAKSREAEALFERLRLLVDLFLAEDIIAGNDRCDDDVI